MYIRLQFRPNWTTWKSLHCSICQLIFFLIKRMILLLSELNLCFPLTTPRRLSFNAPCVSGLSELSGTQELFVNFRVDKRREHIMEIWKCWPESHQQLWLNKDKNDTRCKFYNEPRSRITDTALHLIIFQEQHTLNCFIHFYATAIYQH